MSVEQISDNVWFVLFAYIAAFLPWSFLAAKDFVGPRWKTVQDTGKSGKWTATFSVIPACYVMAYMIVQGLSTDYKEMCAALVALVFSCLNFLRTLWGLWQLHLFRKWAVNSILALKAMGVPYVVTFPDAENFTEIGDIVDHLLVNETIVDNQLAHGEARCFLKYRDIILNGGKNDDPQVLRHLHNIWKGLVIVVRCCFDYGRHLFGHTSLHKIEMVPVQPANVWLNWSVAFVAQGLGGWLKDFSASMDAENEPGYDDATCRERLERRGQHFGLQLVNSALLQLWYENGLCEDASSTSPFHWCGVWDKDSFMEDGVIVKKELLRKAMESGIALPFRASHEMIIGKDVKKTGGVRPGYHSYRRKLMQIVNEVPVREEFDEKVGEFDTEKLEWLTIVLYMGAVAVNRREVSSEKLPIRNSTKETSDNDVEEMKGSQALKNLRAQVYLRSSPGGSVSNGAKVYSTSELLQSVSVQIAQPPKVFLSEYNRHVTKIGEMIDAWMSLYRGNKMMFLSHLNESNFWEDVCRCGNACGMEGDKSESFCSDDSKAIQAIHAEVEKRQFYYNIANTANKYNPCDQFVTFMGYGMEAVRSRLGSWVAHNQDEGWSGELFAPLMENLEEVSVDLGLELSQVLFDCLKECNLSHRGIKTRLLWELQQALAKADDGGPESACIIILCVLSFPSVSVEVKEEERCCREEVTCKPMKSCVLVGFGECVGRKKLSYRRDDERDTFPRIKICAKGGPQGVEIVGTFSERDGVLNVKLRLGGSEEVKRFRWTLWRDAFLGRLNGLKEWQEEHGILSAELNLTYGEMKGTVENVELPTGEKVVCWGGWKPFRFEFMRFELESKGFLKEQFVAGVEHADHLLRGSWAFTKEPKDRSGQLLTCQAKTSMYYCLDSLPRMRVEPVDYTKASGVTLRHAFLIVEEALAGAAPDTRETDDIDSSVVLIRHAEECLRSGSDWERAVSVLEIAATVYGSGAALEQCVSLLIEQSREKRVGIRVVRLLERFQAQLYSSLSLIDPGPSVLSRTDEADDYLFPTCSKVMERFGDDDLISGRLSTLFAHAWLINQAHFGKKTLAALQTLYSMSRDVRVMDTLSQVLYDDFSSANTDKELQGNVERFTGLNGSVAESHISTAGELNRDILRACGAFAREATHKLDGKQRKSAEIRLATITAWGSCSTDEVYQQTVALYQNVIESSEGMLITMAIISWATLVVEGCDGHNEKEMAELIGFSINQSDIHAETETIFLLAEAVARGSRDKAQMNKKAIELYRHAIEGGNAQAMNNLGWMLQRGVEGVPQDTEEAARLYRRAIEGGNVQAMNNLGWMFERGVEGVPQDAVEAARLYHRAIEGGNVYAMRNLGWMLERGVEGVPQDTVQAAHLYRRAIEGGDVYAMNNLGWMLQRGVEGVPQDTVEAARLYRRAIEGGNVNAMRNLALMLEDGAEGVPQDTVQAVRLYRRAIEGGNVYAMRNLGWMLQRGVEGVPQDTVEAARLYRRAIEGGNVYAMFNLALILEYGAEGVPQDTVQAVRLYRRAIEDGNVYAMTNLGWMLQRGVEGVPQDTVQAARLYRRAIEGGEAQAMNNLGWMLERGVEGVPQDTVEAARLYRRAIQGGNAQAMCNLASILEDGAEGVPQDTLEAAHLYRSAIEGGEAQAMFNLALMLEYGAEGVPQDKMEAAKLYRRAIEGGNVDAMYNLASILENGAVGVVQDVAEAELHYRRAIEGGNVSAIVNLGLMLENGADGVGLDAMEAAKLFRRAIEYGNLDAMWSLAVLLQNGSEGVEQNVEQAQQLMSCAWEGLCNGGCG